MEDLKNKICRLCLGGTCDENFTIMEDCTRDMLGMLLLKPVFAEGTSVMCDVCSKKLFEAFEFKSRCLHTENTIKTHVYNAEKSSLDIVDIYMEEIDNKELVNMLGDIKVCRLCLELVETEFKSVQEMDSVILQSFIPEVDFNFTTDPEVCKGCFESVHKYAAFLGGCVNIQGNCIENIDNVGTVCIKNEDIKMETTETNFKVETVEIEEVLIKSEECDGNRTEDGCESQELSNQAKPVNPTISEENMKSEMLTDTEEIIKKSKKNNKSKLGRANGAQVEKQRKIYNCTDCEFRTAYRKSILTHRLRHKSKSTVEYKIFPTQDQSKQVSLSQLQTYKCDECDYQGNSKCHLKNHQLKHRDVSKLETLKCGKCDFETKFQTSLAGHQRAHMDKSERNRYKCDDCHFQTNNRQSLSRHRQTHKRQLQVEKPDFTTILVVSDQSVKHNKDTSKIQDLVCDKCKFKTKYKASLERHYLVKHGGEISHLVSN